MNGEEKTFSTYLTLGETQGAASASFLNNNRVGVIVSMAIHALFIALFLLQPAAKMAAVKTFQISFSEGGPSFSQKSPPSVGNPVKKHAALAMQKQAGIPNQKVAAASAAPKEIAPAPPSPVVEKKAAVKPLETTLPIVADDPADVRGDTFIAAIGNIAPISPSQTGAAVPATGRTGSGSGAGNFAGIASKGGSGSNFGNGTSSGAGGDAPIETRFGQTNAPSFIHREIPDYPPLARRRGKEGRVVLTLLIDQTGKVQKIDVTEPAGFGLTEAAIEAVKKSTFAPAHVGGKKVPSRAVLPIRFKLE
jgi:protein TonB